MKALIQQKGLTNGLLVGEQRDQREEQRVEKNRSPFFTLCPNKQKAWVGLIVSCLTTCVWKYFADIESTAEQYSLACNSKQLLDITVTFI